MYIIAGTCKNRRLVTPKGLQTRPTASRLRETLFNICQNFIEGACFLDLFAGSGAIGFEALSRGAASCTFVDSSKESIAAIRQNAKALGFESNCHISLGDVFALLQLLQRKKACFDMIYVDPPYEKSVHFEEGKQSYSEKVIHVIDTSPSLLKRGGFLFIEDVANFSSLNLLNLKIVSVRKAGRACLTQFQL